MHDGQDFGVLTEDPKDDEVGESFGRAESGLIVDDGKLFRISFDPAHGGLHFVNQLKT